MFHHLRFPSSCRTGGLPASEFGDETSSSMMSHQNYTYATAIFSVPVIVISHSSGAESLLGHDEQRGMRAGLNCPDGQNAHRPAAQDICHGDSEHSSAAEKNLRGRESLEFSPVRSF